MLRQMRVRFRIWPALAGVVCATLLTGCGGIHAEKGFSPLSLLLPGIMKNEPEKPVFPEPVVLPEESAPADKDEEIAA